MEKWQKNALEAIGDSFLMGDRDSCPGQYLSRLIVGGFLSAEEVEGACIECLIQKKFEERHGHLAFGEVISMPGRLEPKFQKLSSFIAAHFSELFCVAKEDWSKYRIVHAASLAKDMSRTTWSALDKLFMEKYWNDVLLFESLYVNNCHSSPMLRERKLQFVAKNARYVKRARGENGSCLKALRYMLHLHFGFICQCGQADYGLFGHAEARAERWIQSQNAHVAP